MTAGATDEAGLRAALEKSPRNPRLNTEMMNLLRSSDRPEEALVYGLRLLDGRPKGPKPYAEVLRLVLDLKLTGLATLIAEHAIRSGITDVRIYAALARSKALQGDWDGVEATFGEAEQLYPNHALLESVGARLAARREKFTASAAD